MARNVAIETKAAVQDQDRAPNIAGLYARKLDAYPDGSRSVEAKAAINVWVKLYQEERDRLVRAAKTAIDAGVEERQVRLAEQQAQQLAAVIRAILTDLGHDLEDDRVRKVVRLRLLEGAGEASSPRFGEPSAEASRDGDEDVPKDAS